MKKHANIRSILIALSILLAMGLGTTVFAEPETGQIGTTATEQTEYDGISDRSLPNADELLSEFMLSQAGEELGEEPQKEKKRGSRLTGHSAIVYGILVDEIESIANGDRAYTCIEIPVTRIMDKMSYTAEELGVEDLVVYDEGQGGYVIALEAKEALGEKLIVNDGKIIESLLADSPYDLYWFDKKDGAGCHYNEQLFMRSDGEEIWIEDTSYVSFGFCVSCEYAQEIDSEHYNLYMVDKDLTALPKQAAETAAGIVADADGKSDYERLKTYRNEICQRVVYNHAAADDKDTPYGNPWQLVYVFDGNSETNVVCEGYSKAYKFLCDITDLNDLFNNESMDCYLVSGPISFDDGSEKVTAAHMWNVVTMGEDRNYLVDVTSCDEDGSETVCTSDYFLKGDPNGSANGYTVKDVTYEYDAETRGLYDDAELTLSTEDYDSGSDPEGIHVHSFGPWHVVKAPTYDEEGEEICECVNDTAEYTCDRYMVRAIAKLKKTSIKTATVTGISDKTYNGKALTQAPAVKLGGKTLKNGTDYKVTYKNNKNVGSATVTITGMNAYDGSLNKTFKINPKGTTLKSLKKAKKGFTAKWNKQATQTSGYQIRYCLKSNFKSGVKTVTVNGSKNVNRKVTKLKAKKNYYVQIRTFKTVGKTKYYSGWSKAKKIKTK